MINYESVKKMLDKPSIKLPPKQKKKSDYSDEFKKEVVSYYSKTKSITDTAKFFGVAYNSARAWINEV